MLFPALAPEVKGSKSTFLCIIQDKSDKNEVWTPSFQALVSKSQVSVYRPGLSHVEQKLVRCRFGGGLGYHMGLVICRPSGLELIFEN